MNTHEISADDLALYAMRSLESDDVSRISGHLGSCISCRTELQRIRTDLAAVALTAPEVAPPPRVRERLFADIREEAIHQLGSSPKPAEAAYPRWWAATYTGALMLAVAAGLLWTENARLRFQLTALRHVVQQEQAQRQQEQTSLENASHVLAMLNSRSTMRVRMMAGAAKREPQAEAIYSREQGRLLLMASNLRPLPEHKVYQLWILPMQGAPISAGMLKPDAQGSATMMCPQAPVVEAKGFALTVEPEEGSPAPTSNPVLVGEVSS
ncbi:MAG: anti-sigma factor [Candidatus Korobacteraceae bacterium]|jgi:anti-sigma-K factor RskA